MIQKLKSLVFLLAVIFSTNIIAQNTSPARHLAIMDSLNNALKGAKHDTTRLRIYMALEQWVN